MTAPRGIRILYMEDDPGLARLFQKRLTTIGFVVDTAPDGEEGLVKYMTGRYDVLALDHLMPKKTGLEVIRILASAGELPPTIMVTGAGNETVAVEAMKLGASDYIIKDVQGRYLELIPAVIEQTLLKQRLVSEKQQAEQAVRESEMRLRSVLESMPILMTAFDDHGRIMVWNRECERSTGYPRNELVGNPAALELLFPDREAQERIKPQVARNTGDFLDVESDLVCKDGSVRTISWSKLSRQVPIPGWASWFIGIDVTRRRKSEKALLRSERLKAVGELAGGVAHNFNNVLQIILGAAQLALSDLKHGPTDDIRDSLDQIVENAISGAQTVKRLQSFARLIEDGGSEQGAVFDLTDVVTHALEMSRIWWNTIPAKSGIAMTLTPQLSKGCMVSGKAAELFDAAVNLIRNAAEALPRGGTIIVRTYRDGEWVVLEVEDNGQGIAEGYIEKVFEPFFSTKGSNSTGMGLSSTLGIVESHEGSIHAENLSDHGALFRVKLPAAGNVTDCDSPRAGS